MFKNKFTLDVQTFQRCETKKRRHGFNNKKNCSKTTLAAIPLRGTGPELHILCTHSRYFSNGQSRRLL